MLENQGQFHSFPVLRQHINSIYRACTVYTLHRTHNNLMRGEYARNMD